MVWAVWRKLIGGFIREDGVSEVPEFRWDGLKPSFLVSGESSYSWVIGSCSGGCPYLGGVAVVFEGKVNLGTDTEAGNVLFLEVMAAVLFGFDGGEDVLTPPRKMAPQLFSKILPSA